MKRIFLKQKEVNLGDKIELAGRQITLTEQLLNDLPELFVVEEENKKPIFTNSLGHQFWDENSDVWWFGKLTRLIENSNIKHMNINSCKEGDCTSEIYPTKEIAEEQLQKWIKENDTEKDYEYFENILLFGNFFNEDNSFYFLLKMKEPKLFYLKIMEMIAYEFGRGKFNIYNTSVKYSYIETKNSAYEMNIFTKESAKKCIEIMGEERLNVVFNIKKP